jgi:flagellar M-ring protein FliF
MDFLNKAIAQVNELFRSMTPGARVTAGLLLAVVVVTMAYLFRQGAAGPDAYLFGGEPLPESQLTRVEAAIAQAGLSGYQREGNRIRVPSGQQAEYLAAVADAGALPPNFNTILESALDKGGPWESAAATRERLKIARQQTLSEIVRAMYWVEDAVVLYDEQEQRAAGKLTPTRQKTASVNVKPIAGEALDPRRAKMLQKLVASAVNMNSGDVNVTSLGDGTIDGSDGSVSFEIFDDEYLQTKVAYELQKRKSILNALGDIPGVRVEVNAEFDKTIEEVTRNVKPDKNATTPARTLETNQESSQTTTKGGGQPGTIAQGPLRQGASEAAQQNSNTTKSGTEETVNAVGMEENRILRKGYAPKEVWATVTVPGSYIERVWKSRNSAATEPPKPEDLTLVKDEVVRNIENVVEPLLLLQAIKGENTYKHVRVVVLDSLPVPAIEPPSTANRALAWTGRYWSTLAMLGVAMFSLLVLRSVVRGGSSVAAAGGGATSPALTLHVDEPAARAGNSEEQSDDDRPRLRLKKGKSLKDDLVEIVREDPDVAAEILRSWIGKAG